MSGGDEQLKQLEDARKLVLGDSAYYPQIIQGILPIIGPESRVELRRWGADFLAETFSTPTLPSAQKETLSLIVLETLKSMIEHPSQDSSVVKSVVQTAASIYPLVFRWIVNNPYDTPTWERMTAIKSRILSIWDTSLASVRICCIKFAQRVVMVQTAGPETDRHRGEPLEISIVMVPQTHSLLPPRNLAAEASGLLDRMLGIFHENAGDAVLVDATLNSLSILIRARPPISQKILGTILNFNPLKLANSPMTPKSRVMIKSMEKTTRMLLIHITKRDPTNPLTSKIHQQIEKLYRSRSEIFDESTKKRGPPEPTDGLDSAKRQRLAGPVALPATRVHIAPLAPGIHTMAELFTATSDEALKAFDVGILDADLVLKIVVMILGKVDPDVYNQTINGIRSRVLSLSSPQAQAVELNPNTAPLGIDDDDDYEPDFEAAEDTEQILNKLDSAPPQAAIVAPQAIALGTFKLEPPPAMSAEETAEFGRTTVTRVFGIMQTMEDVSSKKNKAGINRLAASSNDKDAWVTVISRLATRSVSGLEHKAQDLKSEEGAEIVSSLSTTIRESLYHYVVEDFRKRTDVAVAWLCEEWYNDKMLTNSVADPILHYDKWVLRVLDGIMPYLDAKDKFLTRFLGEIPGLNIDVLDRVKGLCRDPAKVNLAVTSLFYLVVMRPPAREMALDAMQDCWRTYEDAKPITAKYLAKYRPGFVDSEKAVKDNGEVKLEVTSSGQSGITA